MKCLLLGIALYLIGVFLVVYGCYLATGHKKTEYPVNTIKEIPKNIDFYIDPGAVIIEDDEMIIDGSKQKVPDIFKFKGE